MALAQIIPLFPGKKPDLPPAVPLFPVLDLKKINPGQILTVCFEFNGDINDRTKVSFLITEKAGFNIRGTTKGILVGCHFSQELKRVFHELSMSIPLINDPCILFGSCVKDKKCFLGVGKLRLNRIIKYKLFYWAVKFKNKQERPLIFPYPISFWIIH